MLVNNCGRLKIADFGLSREFNEKNSDKYTQKVVTLWYRPPEILLGSKNYKSAVDLWSVGIVFAELVTKKPFLQVCMYFEAASLAPPPRPSKEYDVCCFHV